MHHQGKVFSIVELANGERAGLGAVEITTVPHLSILQKRFRRQQEYFGKKSLDTFGKTSYIYLPL